MGVVGSFLLDKYREEETGSFHFKHHYILHALDSQILLLLLQGIREKRAIDVTMVSVRKEKEVCHAVCPLNLLISTQTGRQYLLCYHYRFRRPMILRMDNIHSVKMGNAEKNYEKYFGYGEKFRENLWGVSSGADYSLDHIELIVHVEPWEGYIVDRLQREKRCGSVEAVDERTYRFAADVYDASEMLPWLRTFTGRVEKLECSNPAVNERFYGDLKQMQAMYGGEDHGV